MLLRIFSMFFYVSLSVFSLGSIFSLFILDLFFRVVEFPQISGDPWFSIHIYVWRIGSLVAISFKFSFQFWVIYFPYRLLWNSVSGTLTADFPESSLEEVESRSGDGFPPHSDLRPSPKAIIRRPLLPYSHSWQVTSSLLFSQAITCQQVPSPDIISFLNYHNFCLLSCLPVLISVLYPTHSLHSLQCHKAEGRKRSVVQRVV